MKTALITGVAGFLGRYLAREFGRAGWRVVGLDDVSPENAPSGTEFRRLRLPAPAFSNLLAEVKPEVCLHAAGRASVGFSMQEPALDFRDGVALTFELLDALRRHAPKCRFVFLSSAAVYGNPPSLPVAETHPTAPLSPYGYHKLQSELVLEEFARIYGQPTLSARIFSAYGPGLRRQVVWDICERALTTGRLQLRGTGRESRDFIHGADIARAILLLTTKAPAEGEVYNLASGVETTVADLADRLMSQLGLTIAAEFDGHSAPGDPLNWRADISRLERLGFTPETSLDSGLRSVANWCAAELAGPR